MRNKYIDNQNGTSLLIVNSPKHGRLEYLVDTEDINRLKNHRWSAKKCGGKFYAHTGIGNKRKGFAGSFALHRYVMSFASEIYDHIDRDQMNNTKKNLRPSTPTLNNRNRDRPNNATSKYRGVYKRKPVRKEKTKYRVQIRCAGKIHNFGSYSCEIEAAKRYNIEAKRIYGDYANLNVI